MRVTFNMLPMKYLTNLENSLTSLTNANEKVTKGRTLLNPEENPVKYVSAINIQRMLDETEQFKKNSENALTWITNTDNELQRAVDLVSQAKNQYAIAGANDSQNATSRKALAGDVYNMLQSIIDVGNANYMGRYIFGGFETEKTPFAVESREISAVKSDSPNVDIVSKKVYGDMPEAKEGLYNVSISVDGNNVVVRVMDKNSNVMFLDSNNSDETASGGNKVATEIVTGFKPGSVINTGLGFGVKLSDDTNFTGANLSFYYKPGNDVRYHGDDGKISSKIGYNQDVTLNLTGKEVFMEADRVLMSTRYNTVKGLGVTETTLFSQIEGANVGNSDYIEIKGTDHYGFKVGTAKALAGENVKLDMTLSTSAERTLNLTYAGKEYNLTMDQKGYKDIDEVVFGLNRILDANGLNNEIEAVNDGDRVMFVSTRAGNMVNFTVKGSINNALGFDTVLLDAKGKDTFFEFNYDNFKTDNPISLSFSSISSNSASTTNFIINGTKISFMPQDSDSSGNLDQSEIETALDNALKEAGLFFNISYKITNFTPGVTANYDISFGLENVNYGNNTYLAINHADANSYKYTNAVDTDYPSANEKRVGDFLNFVQELYNYTADAKIENGKIVVRDVRSGNSKFSLSYNESNTGLGYPSIDKNVSILGTYEGGIDDTWKILINSATETITVTDSKKNTILNKSISGYSGEIIDIASGVSVVLNAPLATRSFLLDVKANSNLSFGDMNIIQEGKNVDTFRSLKNLYDALNYNISDQGISAPSAWSGEDELKSTANPYFDGTFRGNYNDIFTYEVAASEGSTSFYLQNELVANSENVMSIPSGSALNFDIIVGDKDGNPDLYNFSFTANATAQDIINTINNDPALLNAGVKASINENKLFIRSGSGLREIEINTSDVATATALGITQNVVYSKSVPALNLDGATAQNRALTLKYFDGTNWTTSSYTIPDKNFASVDELVLEINSLGLPAGITAVNRNEKISFDYSGGITNLLMEGDHEGTLGFYKYGDTAKIKVSGSDGELINYLTIDTANTLEDVADGVKLAFDSGTLYTSESFTSAVGSGIRYEIPVLDKAETQFTTSLTVAGTRQNRVDSVINFHESIKTTNEELKAKYLGATEFDMTKSITEFQLAQQAYQMAMSTAASVLQMSIMDYLR